MTGGTAHIGIPDVVHAAALCAAMAAWLVVMGRSRPLRRARVLLTDGGERSSAVERWCGVRSRIEKRLRGRWEWLCLPVASVPAVLGQSVLPLIAGAAAVPLARRWLLRRRARKEQEARANGVGDLCGALVGELRAGREPGEALLVAVRGTDVMGDAGFRVSAAARFGGDVPRALVQAAGEPGLEGLAGVAACWRVSVGSGAGLATGLGRLESALRAERRQRDELRAQLAGAWSTVVVLAVLPVIALVLGAALGADPLRVLLHSTTGLVCLVTGGLLEVCGLFWASRIVRAGEAG
ncbi:type II secretion system F family protein [Streptomyces drozdowiczii]|uniref:Type II secretion system F family protein n=1 Tax=Streptomyces drozdowiczii TaxID=202862 RepID=A0ABY6PTK1_9ACTN|nr:type II secretion system F family protein [Streptomyces drozdowiczii]MCX0244631.1 type II secretion system F family protein [Streptomyces drozdowiczii]UZK55625.1 type II secretion system F family protein [Streptomyces drozdowiczii]